MGGIQEHDRSLILEFSWAGYKGKELAALNVVRRYRNLLHVSNISKCDGITLNKFVILDMAEAFIHHTFPCNDPTPSDFFPWKDAIVHLCFGSMHLLYTLGKFLCHPHLPQPWYTTLFAGEIYNSLDGNPAYPTYEIYHHKPFNGLH